MLCRLWEDRKAQRRHVSNEQVILKGRRSMPHHLAVYLLAATALTLAVLTSVYYVGVSNDKTSKKAAAAGSLLVLVALVGAEQVHAGTNNTGQIPLKLVGVKSPVARGDHGALVAALFPNRPRCTISVGDKNDPLRATGLHPLRPALGGKLAWTWKVGAHTALGRWPILVDCGTAGTLRTQFMVIR